MSKRGQRSSNDIIKKKVKVSSSSSSSEFDEEDELDEYKPINYQEILKNECNTKMFRKLSPQLRKLCKNIENKKITLTKILNSALLCSEKEKALELYGIMCATDEHSFEYLKIQQLLSNMIFGTAIAKSNDVATDKLLLNYQKKLIEETPTLEQIMAAHLTESEKFLAIQTYQHFYQVGTTGEGLYSETWFNLRNKLKLMLSKSADMILLEESLSPCLQSDNDMTTQIINLNANMDIKRKIYQMMVEWTSCQDDTRKDSMLAKIKLYLRLPYDTVVTSPSFTSPEGARKYCLDVYSYLNNHIYQMDRVKEKLLLCIHNHMYTQKNGNLLALKGPYGVGKSKIIQVLADALNRPFAKISFGGQTDSGVLIGSNPVWLGSNCSQILKILMDKKCSNPIILLDEIDKISGSEKGKEMEAALLHILDHTQNNHFNDLYLHEVQHDLSRIWFIATLNDDHKLHPALKDRLDIITVPSYNKEEMIKIIQQYTLPFALTEGGLGKEDIMMDDSSCFYLLQILLGDIKQTGMRTVEREIREIVSKISFIIRTQCTDEDFNLSFKVKPMILPLIIDKKIIKNLVTKKPDTNQYHMMYL